MKYQYLEFERLDTGEIDRKLLGKALKPALEQAWRDELDYVMTSIKNSMGIEEGFHREPFGIYVVLYDESIHLSFDSLVDGMIEDIGREIEDTEMKKSEALKIVATKFRDIADRIDAAAEEA